MKKLLLIATVWLLQSCSYLPDNADKQKNMDIYLLIGQSNMAGRAPIPAEPPLTEDQHLVAAKAFVLNGEGQMIPAQHPLNLYSTIRKKVSMQKAGPGLSFARTMLHNQTANKIGLVVNARGGTKIEQWCDDCQYYKDAIARAKLATRYGTLKGILWLQGESDVKQPKGYLEKLSDLVGRLRQDLALPHIPFVAAQVYQMPAINQQIAQLPNWVENTGVVSTHDLHAPDKLHFDFASVETIGRRFAHEMLTLQQKN
ncbi:hypothetical protein C2869_01195 [Saccharobesus litoralis]|uniref:Sialate O-acetylesterase domain-containing protein n=1 Tax=Saccharobesus litoralis TaxID=2172099 RepID=A0A2S0VLR5_9ALTE|nr:sialate O-acetylesterase [Saccharobesus litoralis]AWB65141.1 hypothetical protein C2869_01195 [Saccharobesus litoralis]